VQDDQQSREVRRSTGWDVAIWTGVVVFVWVALSFAWGEGKDCSGWGALLCFTTKVLLYLLALPALVIWVIGVVFISRRAGRGPDPP